MSLNPLDNKPKTQQQSMDAMNNEAIRLLAASGPLIGAGLPGMPNGLGGAPPGMDNPAFRAIAAQAYPMFPFPPELNPEILAQMPNGIRNFYMDPRFSPYPLGLDGSRRKNATREVTAPLKQWLNEHRKNPYPTKGDKVMLAMITSMSMTQVSTWFANARRRLKKENKMTWSPRNRLSDEDDGNDRPTSSLSDISVKDDQEEPKGKIIENGTNRESDSPRKANNVSTPNISKIWSIADTLNGTKDEKPVEKALDTSGSSSASASTSATSPPASSSAASSTAQTITPGSAPMLGMPGGIPMPPVLPPGSLPPGFPATPFPFLNPQIMAMMASQRLPLMPNPFQAMLAQQQAALRMSNVSIAGLNPNMFLNPLLMQTFGLANPIPNQESHQNDAKQASTSEASKETKNGPTSTQNGNAPDSNTSVHSSRSSSPVASDLSINGANATNPANNLNLITQN